MFVTIKKKNTNMILWSIQIFIDLIRHFFGINNYISMDDQQPIEQF